MPRHENASKGVPFSVTIAEQSVDLLKRLAKLGPYGRNAAEVGGRLLEQVLTERFFEQVRFPIRRPKKRR
jgi:hypothetical protein